LRPERGASAAAAYFGGVLRTDLGSYLETFMLSGTLCFAAALLVMWIGVDWRRVKPVEAVA
jgi:predicted MFS family arabinose efflux permease